VFVATDPERWRQDGPVAVVAAASQRSQVPRRRRLAMQVVAAERVDVGVRDLVAAFLVESQARRAYFTDLKAWYAW
jgi:hypothetical protein